VLKVLAVTSIDPSTVTPGVAGFLTVFVLAVATWLLIRSMTGHLRKVRYRAEQEEAEAAEAQAAEQAAAKAEARAARTRAKTTPKTTPKTGAKPKGRPAGS
jgi:hypothetical protein